MHIDPNLPCEWRGKVVKKNKAPDRYDVYVFSPCGKGCRSKRQLKRFLDNEGGLLDIDQFSLRLTEDKHGSKSNL